MLDKVYPQGRTLVGLKKKIRDASSSDLPVIFESLDFIRIILQEWRGKLKTDAALDRILEPQKLENIFPGGLEALRNAGIDSPQDYEAISRAINRIPFSAYTQYFLLGLAGGWKNGPHPNTSISNAAKLITSSAEFVAGLRFIDGSLTFKEQEEGVGGVDKLPMYAPDDPDHVKQAIDNLVEYWKKIGRAQMKRKEKKEHKKAAKIMTT